MGAFPDVAEVVFLGAGLTVLAGIAVCDVRWRIVPAILVWPAIVGGVLWRVLRSDWSYIAAAGVIAGAMLAVTLVAGSARAGLGDAQAYTLVGLLIGWLVVLVPAVVAVTALLFYRLMLRQKPAAVPVAPFLWFSTIILLGLKAGLALL